MKIDNRKRQTKEIKIILAFCLGIFISGIGHKIDIKAAEPTWAEQQLILSLKPFIGSCQGEGCIIKEGDDGLEVQENATRSPEINTILPKRQLSDKALDCVAKRPEVAKKISEKFGEYGQEAIELFSRESCLDNYAVNPTSGAAGLVQAYPASKLPCTLDDVDCQVEWGFNYITKRYGNAKNALNFHLENNWY